MDQPRPKPLVVTYSLGHFAFAPLCVDTLRDFLDLLLDLSCAVAAVAAVAVASGDEESSDRDAECGCDEGGGGCECVVPRVGHWLGGGGVVNGSINDGSRLR